MSYTAPQYVDTKEQAILALASVIADEDKSALGDGSVNRALDILADVLAEQDVQVPQTDAGAILALADYVSGGGGSSDFTTAEVTIVNTLGYPVGGNMAMAASEEGNYYSDASPYVSEGETSTFSAILYRGHCLASFNGGGTQTIDGSATAIADGVVDIYGDCTITLANA